MASRSFDAATAPSASGARATALAIITDPGEDLDDEMATLLLRCLVDDGTLAPACVVCNLYPAKARARLMRGTLDTLGLAAVPVGEGSDGNDRLHRDTFSSLASSYIAGDDVAVEDGFALLERTFEAAADGSMTLLCISALTDAATFVRDREALFLRKIREVVIMGGVKADSLDAGAIVPDTAANNVFDVASAEFLYATLTARRVKVVVVTREAAYACPVPRQIYDDVAASGSPIGLRLQTAQRESITTLWKRCHAQGRDARAGLPERCDARWFAATFCGGRGEDRAADDDVWPLVASFNMYDAIALVAAAPNLRRRYFAPKIVTVDGVDHAIIGRSKDDHGVRDVPDLRAFLTDGFLRGIRSPLCSPKPLRDKSLVRDVADLSLDS